MGHQVGGLWHAAPAGTEPASRLLQRLLEPFLERRRSIRHGLDRIGAQRLRDPVQQGQPIPEMRVRAVTGHRLDAPYPDTDAAVGCDDETADLARRRAMRAPAQLQGVALDADRPDHFAVLLVEEGVRPGGDSLGHGPNHGRHGPVVAHGTPDLVFDGPLLVHGERPVHVVVETEVVRGHERSRLMCHRPDHVTQGPVEQMRAGVIAHRPGSPLGVDTGGDGLPHPDPAVKRATMDEEPRDRLLRVIHGEECASAARFEQFAPVADLTATLAVEGSGVEDHFGIALACEFLVFGAVSQDGDDSGLRLSGLIAPEGGLAHAALDRLV